MPGDFLGFPRASDECFEEGSSSSASSSSESESSSGSGSGSESGSQRGCSPGDVLKLSRFPPQSAASASASAGAGVAGKVIYVASSSSETDTEEQTPPLSAGSHNRQELSSETRKLPPPERSSSSPPRRRPVGKYAAVPPPPDAAVDALWTTSACARTDKNGRHGGPSVTDGSGSGGSDEGAVDKKRNESGTTDASSPEILGYYVDCRPDSALLKLAARGRTEASAAAAAIIDSRNGGERNATEGKADLQPEEVGRQMSRKASGSAKRRDPAGPVIPEQHLPGTATHVSGAITSSIPRKLVAPAPPGKKKCEGGSSKSAAATDAESTTACSLPLSTSSPDKEESNKRPRCPSGASGSPPSDRGYRLESKNGGGIGVGGDRSGGGGDAREGCSGMAKAACDGGGHGDGDGDGRLRAVFKPGGGGWVFVKGSGKKGEEGRQKEDGIDGAKTSSMPLVGKDGSAADAAALGNTAAGPSSAALDCTIAAESRSAESETESETASQLARRLRAESEFTARLTTDAARLAVKISSAQARGGFTTTAGGIDDDSGTGSIDDGEEPMPRIARATTGKGENAEGDHDDDDTGRGDGRGNGSGGPTDPEESRHAEGLMALVREQERRNRGGSLPAAFFGLTGEGEGEGATRRSHETLRAARLQVSVALWLDFVFCGGAGVLALQLEFQRESGIHRGLTYVSNST